MYKHILWDFDGTLFDTYPALARALHQALEIHGVSADVQEIYGRMRVTVGAALSYYEKEYALPPEYRETYRALRDQWEEKLAAPYPGIPELLRELKAAGRGNYIFTHRGASLHGLLEKHGLADCFRECVTSENGFPIKPDPAGIAYLMEKYAMNPEESIMIGDRALDVQAGLNAGIAGLAYLDGTGPAFQCPGMLLARSVAEIREILLK